MEKVEFRLKSKGTSKNVKRRNSRDLKRLYLRKIMSRLKKHMLTTTSSFCVTGFISLLPRES